MPEVLIVVVFLCRGYPEHQVLMELLAFQGKKETE